MIKKMCRLIAAVAVPLVCFGMWGCMGCSDEKVVDQGVNVQKFAILNDSTLALFVEYWDEIQFYSGYIHDQEEKTEIVDSKIILVNPFKNFIYGIMNDENKFASNWTQILDSTAFYFSDAFKTMDYSNCKDVHYYKDVFARNLFNNEEIILNVDTTAFDSSDYFFSWKEGRFYDFIIALADVGLCKSFSQGTFFVYDLKKKTIKKWIPSGKSAWIAECKDIQWTEERFRCLMEKEGYVHVLNEKQESLDSLKVADCGIDRCYSFGIRFYGNYIGLGLPIYKINEEGKVSNDPLFDIDLKLWSGGGAYIYLSDGEIISYTKEQLRID